MQKIAARQFFLNQRKALSPSACIKLDDLLLIQFQRIKWDNQKIIGNFFPMEKYNEPNSFLLAAYLKYILPDVKIAYPRILQDELKMEFFEETEEFTHNKWGIAEPLPIHKVSLSQMNTILVPLLGFDTNGHRIGFGKGFYDRYFENKNKSGLRIGISYFDPIAKIEDTDQFDVPLTHCITPSKIYEF
jgi:5-formyltetrahydrofolate cyclo-ligase